MRALKGSILRQEIYARDGGEVELRPYLVSERNYSVERIQPYGPNQQGVFRKDPREAITFHYERALFDIGASKRADPRVQHEFTLAVDSFGNVLRSAAVGYGRRFPDSDPILTAADRLQQSTILITTTDIAYTNAVTEPDVRIPGDGDHDSELMSITIPK